MKRLPFLVLAAPLVLIGASYPDSSKPAGANEAVAAPPAPVTYRPCRPGPGDDRCIQLYERGVRAAYARWLRERGVDRPATEVAAVGGPHEPPVARPRRHDRDSERCDHHSGRHGDARGM